MEDELRKMLMHIMEGQESIKLDVRDLKVEVSELKTDVKKIRLTLDGEINPKIEALFDGYKTNTEKLEELSYKVDDLKYDVNNLSIKTLRSENKIIELDRKVAK